MPAFTPRSARKEADIVTETEKVHVSVRVRPLNKRERTSKKPICLRANIATKQLSLVEDCKPGFGNAAFFSESSDKVSKITFQFDTVFWSLNTSKGSIEDQKPATQADVFQQIGTPLVNHAFGGFNSCLFAYGQTGSGKTYTMMGADVAVLGDNEGSGVAPRIFQEIFRRKTEIESAEGSTSMWGVKVGYVEVYNERVSDLLAKRPKSGEEVFLEIRENPTRGVLLEGQELIPARSFTDVIKCVEMGNKVRHTAATKMNNRSSRSHAIIMVLLQEERMMITKTQVAIRTAGKSSRMNLVDLAGSERVSQSEVEGVRFTEATHINLSLTTLGRVIDVLADMATKGAKTRYTVPPFRDAKLTFILKDSLGGNSKTMMVAAVSPSALNYEETLGTLRYASRARDIVNVARVNEDPRARRIRQLEEEVARMRGSLAAADPSYVAQLEEKIALIESEARNRAADLQALEKEREEMQFREHMLKASEEERAELEAQANLLKRQVEESRRQATEMQRQNLRLREEQSRREKKLLEDVERANEAMRMKEKSLEQAKMELARERTEREEAVRFIQHYKEKLEDALFSSERSAAEKVALEEVNTSLTRKLEELEEEQAQYVTGLVKKLEDCENQMAFNQKRFKLLYEEQGKRHALQLNFVMEQMSLLQEWHKESLRIAMKKEPLVKEGSEGSSNNGVTHSSSSGSESTQQSCQKKRPGELTQGFYVKPEDGMKHDMGTDAPMALLVEEQEGFDQKGHDASRAQAYKELGAAMRNLPKAIHKVEELDEGYRRCAETIKLQTVMLRDTQHALEELIERFFTDSVSLETEEETMASRLSDVELAREAFKVKEDELQELHERLEERARERKMAVRVLERELQTMLRGKFGVRLFFPGEGDIEYLPEEELYVGDPGTPVAIEALESTQNATGVSDKPTDSSMGAPLLPREHENGDSPDTSSIKRSILKSFPISSRVASLLGKPSH